MLFVNRKWPKSSVSKKRKKFSSHQSPVSFAQFFPDPSFNWPIFSSPQFIYPVLFPVQSHLHIWFNFFSLSLISQFNSPTSESTSLAVSFSLFKSSSYLLSSYSFSGQHSAIYPILFPSPSFNLPTLVLLPVLFLFCKF